MMGDNKKPAAAAGILTGAPVPEQHLSPEPARDGSDTTIVGCFALVVGVSLAAVSGSVLILCIKAVDI